MILHMPSHTKGSNADNNLLYIKIAIWLSSHTFQRRSYDEILIRPTNVTYIIYDNI